MHSTLVLRTLSHTGPHYPHMRACHKKHGGSLISGGALCDVARLLPTSTKAQGQGPQAVAINPRR